MTARGRWWLLLVAVAVAWSMHAAGHAAADELPRKALLGVRVATVPEPVRRDNGLQPGTGVVLEEVFPGATAATGGLRRGDVLLAIDGRTIEGVGDFLKTIGKIAVGQRLEVALLREGRSLVQPLTMAERPRDRGDNFDVLYRHVRSHGVRIRTIVTKPHAAGRHPVLFLIQDLGPASIDEPLEGASAYSRIVRAFAGSGYVTVRVEKPGIGDSEGGPYVDTDFDTELDIYRQALGAVTRDAFVDPDHIFLFGHSIGGVFAPILAGESRVRGVAVYGTVVKTWTEYVLENTRRQARLAGSDPSAIDATLRDLAAAMHYLLVEEKTTEEIVRLRPDLRAVLDRHAPQGRLYGRAPRFWSQLARKNLPASWSKVRADVLSLWGRHDFIATEADHLLIAAIVDKTNPGKARYVVVDGVDHVFRQATSIEDSFRRWRTPGAAAPVNPEIIATLTTWTERVRHAR